MKSFNVVSPTYGTKTVYVDDEDYNRVMTRKWSLKNDVTNLYVHTYINNSNGVKTSITLHRFILADQLTDDLVVDHINGNGLDNTRSNLRIVDRGVNARNRKLMNTNTSGFAGVTLGYDKRSESYYWQAKIEVNGKPIARRFYVNKYGLDYAKELAIITRCNMEREYGFIVR